MYTSEPQYFKGAIDATGSISNAWNLVKENYWMYFGMTLVAGLIMFVLSCIPIVGVLLSGPIMGGLYYVFLRAMRNEPIDFGMMFKGFEKFVPLFVVGLVVNIPGLVSQILNMAFRITDVLVKASQGSRRSGDYDFFRPNSMLAADTSSGEIALAGGIIVFILVIAAVFLLFSLAWAITFTFAIPIVVDQDVDIMTALKLSAKSGWSNIGGIIVLAILLWLLSLLGMLALCIGVLFVLPIIYASWTFAYRQVFPDLGPDMRSYAPPPPDAYSGTFGQGQ